MNLVKIEVYKDKSFREQYRWRLKAGNGETVAQGESHPTRVGAKIAAQRLKRLFAIAIIVDIY